MMKPSMKVPMISLAVVMVVASATEVLAGPPGSAWWRFVPQNGGTARLAFRVGANRNPTATVAEYEISPGVFSGRALANALARELCDLDCDPVPSTCDNLLPAQAVPMSEVTVLGSTCVTTNGRGTYTITTNPAAPASGLRIDPVTPTVIEAAQIRWDGVFTSDLLSTFTVRLAPNGNNGIVTFDVEDASEASLGSFNVNTTGQTDLQIHTAIANGYTSLGLGLGAIVCDQNTLATESVDPSGFPGYGVRVTYPSNVRGFEVISLAGQTVTQEMKGSVGATSTVPTMSEWGMAILVALLLITGVWMMRRRQRLQSA